MVLVFPPGVVRRRSFEKRPHSPVFAAVLASCCLSSSRLRRVWCRRNSPCASCRWKSPREQSLSIVQRHSAALNFAEASLWPVGAEGAPFFLSLRKPHPLAGGLDALYTMPYDAFCVMTKKKMLRLVVHPRIIARARSKYISHAACTIRFSTGLNELTAECDVLKKTNIFV